MYNDSSASLKTQPNMLPTKEVAKRVGYTPDYVARLAREGKVAAMQSGRQWLVDPESVKLFALQAEAEKRERQKELREERVQERQRVRMELHTAAVVNRADQAAPLAMLQTVAVVACAFLFGTLLWTSQSEDLEMSAFAFGASEIFSELAGLFDFSVWFAADPQPEPSHTPAFGIAILPDGTTEAELEAVKESFSDEVEVEVEAGRTGVITPVFKNASATESYRFLLVPVVEAGRN